MSANMAFYLTSDTHVTCYDYGTERTPILSLSADVGVHLNIASHDDQPMDRQLAFARDLAAATGAYLASLEAYAAAHPTSACVVADAA